MKPIFIINGPNLNMLGARETHYYGAKNLETINQELVTAFKGKALLSFFQSNHEGIIVDHIQSLRSAAAIVINPGAFTHTSIAIRDALLSINASIIEVHLSNIYRREEFRKISYISDIARGVISGLGAYGYHFAVMALLEDAH